MLKFLLRRLVFYVCTLMVLVYVVLGLIKISPTDPIENLMALGDYVPEADVYESLYLETAKKHHLDLPLFYWNWTSGNKSSDYYRIFVHRKQVLVDYFLKHGANEKLCFEFIDYLDMLTINDSISSELKQDLNLLYSPKQNPFESTIQLIRNKYVNNPYIKQLDELYIQLKNSCQLKNKFPPKLIWHGTENQFHSYISHAVKGDLGHSFVDNQPVRTKIWSAFQFTFFFVLIGSVLAIPFGLWYGKLSATYSSKFWIKIFDNILYLFYAIPLFWLATLLLVFFTTDEYGSWSNIFSTPQAYLFSSSKSPISQFIQFASKFTLPIICLFLHDIGIFSRQVKTMIQGEQSKPYMQTALMKGLSFRESNFQHAYRNTRVNIITMITNGMASFFKGSLVLEFIFNIPGIGRLTFDAVKNGDLPVLLGVVILIFTVTTIIYAIGDILYQKYNPKLKKA